MTEEDKEIPIPKVAEEVQLTIGDISTVKTIIEIASAKGAFEAKELHVVGVTYDRITKWLLANQPPKDAEETSTAEGETKDD
jgi:hypothetical protein